jgi:LuxR family transcriptional regulator, maltose regulon positive regulatory protein
VLCRDGMEQMRADAEAALALVPPGSLWRATAHLLLGISHLLTGDPEVADRILAEAAAVGEDAGADAATVALAERAILATARGDWSQAELLAERARSIARSAWLEEYVTSVLLYAVGARVAIQRGDVAGAQEDLARAQRLRPQITFALPFYAVQARLELASAYAALTAAELRLLRILGTHHSFRGIGEQLHLSRHTVKSHAMSIYRKLDVSSRSEAIRRARELGLLTE